MKFIDALSERTIPVVSDKPIAKRLRQYRGINYIVLDEKEPADVHGIPKELEAYGRGWVDKRTGRLEIDGGPQGSRTGHPTTAEEGFYWGADYDKSWQFQGEQKQGVIYIRGRAGTSTQFLERNVMQILDLIFKRLPRP
jgi:hypothetical protein